MLVAAVVILCMVAGVEGNGYMIDPPSRSSMWRVGFNTTKNYNDMSLNCGNEYYLLNNGKCGVCGDSYKQTQPRDNEAGGKYGRGIIVKNYKQGQDINIAIEITSNFKGFFEFRLCKNDDVTKIVTQDCLDEHVLELRNANGTRLKVPDMYVGTLRLTAVLPAGLTCSQCVLQWKWHTGNNVGTDSNNHECMGCGPQEEYYGCSDISIGTSGGQSQIQVPVTTRPVVYTPRPTHSPVVTNRPIVTPPDTKNYGSYSTCHNLNNLSGFGDLDRWCVESCFQGNCPSICECPDVTTTQAVHTQQPVTKSPTVITGGINQVWSTAAPVRVTGHNEFDSCRGTGLWGIGLVSLDNWCVENCALGNCPSIQCYCPTLHGSRAPPVTYRQTTKSPPIIEVSPTTMAPVYVTPSKKSPDNAAPSTRSPVFVVPTTRQPPVYVPPTTPRPNVIFVGSTNNMGQTTPAHVSGHGRFDSCHGVGLWGIGMPALDNWCVENCALGNCPSIQCFCPDMPGHQIKTTKIPVTTIAPTKAPILKPEATPAPRPFPSATPRVPPQAIPSRHPPTAIPTKINLCHGVNNWEGVPMLTEWCKKSCSLNFCPPEMCSCSP